MLYTGYRRIAQHSLPLLKCATVLNNIINIYQVHYGGLIINSDRQVVRCYNKMLLPHCCSSVYTSFPKTFGSRYTGTLTPVYCRQKAKSSLLFAQDYPVQPVSMKTQNRQVFILFKVSNNFDVKPKLPSLLRLCSGDGSLLQGEIQSALQYHQVKISRYPFHIQEYLYNSIFNSTIRFLPIKFGPGYQDLHDRFQPLNSF